MPDQLPFMILSDAITRKTGLARIARELAQHMTSDPAITSKFRVGTAGMGGLHSINFGFPNYPLPPDFEGLAEVWRDFSRDQRGIMLPIISPGFITVPLELKKIINQFDLWAYLPVDGANSRGRLAPEIGIALNEYSRVLAYTQYGARILSETMRAARDADDSDLDIVVDHLPHGIDTTIFRPYPREQARRLFIVQVTRKSDAKERITPDMTLIGCVATNSPRKDWGLLFQTCQELLHRGLNVILWLHTDSPDKHWNLTQLIDEYSMEQRVVLTCGHLSNSVMAMAYSACDITLGIGSGEGWGYPLAESLACGTPVIHGTYAGGAEFVPLECLVQPIGFRVEYNSGILRPIFSPLDWADMVQHNLNQPASLPDYISWSNCWPGWREWLLKGI